MPSDMERPPSKRASRLVFGAFVLVTAAFVVSTTTQVAIAVFGKQGGAASRGPVGTACATGLAELQKGIEDALADATQPQKDHKEAVERYEASKKASWQRYPDVARTCEADPKGPDALAALLRYDRAAEGAALRQAEGLGRVRREVDSFIR